LKDWRRWAPRSLGTTPPHNRSKVEPTDDWEQLKLLVDTPKQLSYELIRPVVLFGRSPAAISFAAGAYHSRATPKSTTGPYLDLTFPGRHREEQPDGSLS
jgi:hypothetical protein